MAPTGQLQLFELLAVAHSLVRRDELPASLLSSLRFSLTHSSPSYARLVLHRSLLFLHETIKSLSSNRMMKGRVLMIKIGEEFFSTLRELHERMLNGTVEEMRREGLAGGEEIEEMELALLAFKSLSKLLVYGTKDASEDEAVKVSEI